MAIFTVVIPPSITQQWKTLCIVFEFASIHSVIHTPFFPESRCHFMRDVLLFYGHTYIFLCVCVYYSGNAELPDYDLFIFTLKLNMSYFFFAYLIARFQNCLHGWEACYFQSCFHHINSFRATCQITVKMAPWDSFNSDFNYGN